jgi:hypothetical protein
MRYFPDWQAAAEASTQDAAVSDPVRIYLPRHNYAVIGEIVKPRRGDPWFAWKSAPGIKVYDGGSGPVRPTAKDCDQVRRWRPFGGDKQDRPETVARQGGA